MEAYGQVKGRKYPHEHGTAVAEESKIDDGLIECTRCHKLLPQDRYYKYKGRIEKPCIACRLKQEREKREMSKTKKCNICGEKKPLKEFEKIGGRRYHPYCRECHREYHREREKTRKRGA